MDEQEYRKWRSDAMNALSMVYQPHEVKEIIDWMDNIKGSGERDLVGSEVLECLMHIASATFADKHWSLYNNMMMRMWLYAPYILAESK